MILYRLATRGLLAGLLMLALVPPCAAQRPPATNVPKELEVAPEDTIPYGQRTDAFLRLLLEFGFQPLHGFSHLQTNPSESILIVLGDPNCLSRKNLPNGLRSFVERGGAVLIATDKETVGEAGTLLKELAGVRVTGDKLRCLSPNATDIYSNSEHCPFVQPVVGLSGSTAVLDALTAIGGAGGRPDLFRPPPPHQQPLRVAANAPSQLRENWWGLPRGIHQLARLPANCTDEEIGKRSPKRRGPGGPPRGPKGRARNKMERERSQQSERPLFAVGGTVGKGRILVLADHSLFINRMILPHDNGNLEFTANCLHWLRGGISTPAEALHAMRGSSAPEKFPGQRDKLLLWDDGDIHKDFTVSPKLTPVKPPLDMEPTAIATLDRTVTRMEEENVFNRNLRQQIEEMPGGWPRVARTAVYALTLMLVLLLGYLFLWRGRHRPEPAVPLLAHAVSRHEPRASLLEQRRRALLRSGNVWETAHQLVRQYFETAGIPLSGDSPPRVTVRGGWWQRQRIGRRVTRLWRLARGEAPILTSPAALNRWLRELEELKTALANGTIQLT